MGNKQHRRFNCWQTMKNKLFHHSLIKRTTNNSRNNSKHSSLTKNNQASTYKVSSWKVLYVTNNSAEIIYSKKEQNVSHCIRWNILKEWPLFPNQIFLQLYNTVLFPQSTANGDSQNSKKTQHISTLRLFPSYILSLTNLSSTTAKPS